MIKNIRFSVTYFTLRSLIKSVIFLALEWPRYNINNLILIIFLRDLNKKLQDERDELQIKVIIFFWIEYGVIHHVKHQNARLD